MIKGERYREKEGLESSAPSELTSSLKKCACARHQALSPPPFPFHSFNSIFKTILKKIAGDSSEKKQQKNTVRLPHEDGFQTVKNCFKSNLTTASLTFNSTICPFLFVPPSFTDEWRYSKLRELEHALIIKKKKVQPPSCPLPLEWSSVCMVVFW